MRHLIHFLPKLVWIAILSLTNSLSAQVFVDLSATGANDGTSWANAYTDLQEAIDNSDNATIWVAQGIYYPSSCNACSTANREQAFELKNNITLLGGFNGTESASRDRDIEANPTILSGDIGTRGDSTDNSYHVVVANNNQLTAQLDGFTIEHGNADAPGFDRGGGLYINGSFNNSSSPSIRKCTFRNNYASGGGAIGIDATAGGACRPSITGCRFENNTAALATTSFGGAILGVGSQGANISPQISDCQFINNYSGHHGGALAFSLSGDQSRMGAFIARCTFIGNEANERGGAIWSRMTTNAVSSWILGNSLFENNHAGAEGGAIYNRISFDSQGDDQILTSVFRKNSTDKSGGAVYLRGSQGANSEVDVVHCTFDQNQSADKGGAVYKDADEFAPGSLDTRILNCTFWQNEAMNSGGDVYLEQGGGQLGFELHNSILWEGSDPGIGSSNASGRVSHCILQHPLPDDLIDGGNNFSEDPVFADAAAGDFHPLRCSPAIDAGDNDALPLTFNADRDGKPRISNGTIDLGIYESQRIYVNSSATTNGNGQSWATPYNRLDQGVNNATAGDEVWVAAGTYKPSVSGNRALSFNIQSGAEVYGGFAGTENSLSERNISANPTILSGEIGTASSTDNSFRVVTIGDAVKKTSLDGFIIEAANNDLVGNGSGGGLFLDAREGRSCQPTIRHCVFRNNRATGGGAVGMEANQGGKLAPTFEQCQFENNSSTDAGGGLFYDGSSSTEASIQLTSCQFTSNQSNQHGGAIALRSINNDTELHTYLDSCTFEENNTQGQGGALWLQDSDNAKSQVRLRSCQFSENQSDQQGGALYLHDNTGASSNDTLLNCLFTKNASITNGGALFLGGTQQGNNQTILINCVFDRNEAGQQGGGLYSDADENGGGNVQTRVINNSFSRNFSNGQGGGIYIENGNGSSDINIANSILWDNNAASGAAELATDAASGNITHSIIRGGIPSNVSDDGGNLFVDPQFIDPANGNLKTSGCSPAIDKGSDDLLPIDISDIDNDIDKVERIDIDLEGNTRIFQLAVDMGAFEWNGNPTPLEVSSTQTNVSCNSACDGVANLLTNGGVPGYTFLWSTGETTASISDLCAGTYTVTITDANKCLLTESITISENAVLSSSISAGMTLCANEQANISLTANGGDGNYTYNWDNGLGNAANHSVSPSNTTTYSVTITDGRGCSDQQSVTILVNALPEPLASETLNLCSGSNIDLDAGPFEDYAWSTGAGTQTINIDRAGTYAVTVTDVNNCQGTDSVKVRQVANPTPVLEGSKTFCVGGSTTFDPGSSFSAYEWSNGSLNQTLTVFATGTYAVTVTDANGCSGSAQVFAEANGMLESSIEGILSICQGATTDLEATEYDSYLWSTGETTRVINVGSGGTYSVTVTDDSGCTGVSSVDVLDNTSPNLNITGDTSYCAGSTTTLSVFPTFSEYLWSNGSGAQSIDVGSAGNYEVMVTDANGCTAMSQVVITETAIPQASITGTDSICEGDFTFLMGGSFERYQWSTGDSTQMISVREDGLYALTVTDDNGCTGSEEFELTVNANPIPQINGLPNYCPGGSTVLGGGSFSSWAWSTGANSRMINVSTAGSYGLTVTDANGCTGEASLNVFEINTLNPVIEGTTSYCKGDSTFLSSDDFSSYSWSTGASSRSIFAKEPGLYSLTVTQDNGCMGTVAINVSENQLPDVDLIGNDVFCQGESTLISGGDGYTSYLWSNGDTLPAITVDEADTYALTVTDDNGCMGEASLAVTENPAVAPTIGGDPLVCPGVSTTLDGGDYMQFSWSNGDTSRFTSVSMATAYQLTVTDSFGCTGSGSITVENAPPLNVLIGGQLSFCTDETTVLSGGDFETFLWSTGDTSQSIQIGSRGTYGVTVTDARGCSGSNAVDVIENDKLVPNIIGAMDLCDEETTTLEVGTFDFYLWSTGGTSENILAASPGTYSVTVSAESGCEGVDSIVIGTSISTFTEEQIDLCFEGIFQGTSYTANDTLQVVAKGSDGCDSLHTFRLNVFEELELAFNVDEECVQSGAEIAVVPDGGNGVYNYLWEDGSVDSTRRDLEEGLYFVTLTDTLGCETFDSIRIAPTQGIVVDEQIVDVRCNGENNGQISLIPESGMPPFAYQWSTNDSTENLQNLGPGTYEVLIQDANGCNLLTAFVVMEPAPLNVQVSTSPSTMGNNGMAVAVVNGGITPYTYSWSTGDTEPAIDGLAAGTYGLTITDANGCSWEEDIQIEQTTSLEEIGVVQQLNIFPNPSKGKFQIDIQLAEAAVCHLRLYNLRGQQLQSLQTAKNTDVQQALDLSELAAGTYLLDIEIKGQHLGRQLIKIE